MNAMYLIIFLYEVNNSYTRAWRTFVYPPKIQKNKSETNF